MQNNKEIPNSVKTSWDFQFYNMKIFSKKTELLFDKMINI